MRKGESIKFETEILGLSFLGNFIQLSPLACVECGARVGMKPGWLIWAPRLADWEIESTNALGCEFRSSERLPWRSQAHDNNRQAIPKLKRPGKEFPCNRTVILFLTRATRHILGPRSELIAFFDSFNFSWNPTRTHLHRHSSSPAIVKCTAVGREQKTWKINC